MADPSPEKTNADAGDAPPKRRPTAATRDAPSQQHHRWQGLRNKLHARRERIRANPTMNTTYRIALGAFGTVVLVAGILLIPYPGPGWLIVFAGLGILATEFHWAHRVNVFTKRQYHRWLRWISRQHWGAKLAFGAITGVVVLATLWLLGMFSLVGGILGLHWPWLASPLLGP